MKAAVRVENGVVIGTSGNKYNNPNPILRHLLREFDRAVSELAAHAAPSKILEVGCGEGHVTKLLLDSTNASILATDISATMVAEAKQSASSERVTYWTANVADIEPIVPAPDLVVCCEVLEHLPNPEQGLKALWAQRAKWYLLSVPREPLFRAMNFARGAYCKDFGNSPGHLQHWSQRGFLNFVDQAFEKVIVRAPIPWTVVLCRPRDRCLV